MAILIQKITSVEEIQEREIIEKLCYILCGFDTRNIYLENNVDGISIIVDGMNDGYVMMFKYLILQIREYSKNKEAIPFIEMYLKKVSRWRREVKKVEELYIKMNEFVGIFKELENGICLQDEMEVVIGNKLNLIKEYLKGKENINNYDIFLFSNIDRYKFISWICKLNFIGRYFEENRSKKTIKKIEQWINYANVTNIIKESVCEEFNMCLWKDKFKINFIKGLDKLQLQIIEECGKIIYFLRNIFKIEIINDLPEFEKNLKQNDNFDLNFKLKNNGKDKNFKLNNKNEYLQLKPIDLSNDIIYKINQRNFEIVYIFNNIIFPKISFECDILYDIIFFQEFSLHLELFEEFHKKFLTTNNSIILKVNHFLLDKLPRVFSGYYDYFNTCTDIINSKSIIKCEISDILFSEYVFKLLHATFSIHSNPHLTLLERFTYSFNPGFLKFFFSVKVLTEIKIISRFLFLINIIIYYFEISPKYNFTRKIYLIFMHLKNYKIKKKHKLHKSKDVIELFNDIEKQIYDLLQRYYLTNTKIFIQISILIEIALEYIQIEYKEHIDPTVYEERIMEAINRLIEEIKVNSRDDYFIEFLQRF